MERGVVDLSSATQLDVSNSPPDPESVSAVAPVESEPETSRLQLEEKSGWPVEKPDRYPGEADEGMSEAGHGNEASRATNLLIVPPPARRPLPRKVRRALLVFCIVGTLALCIDCVLLALSIMRHHIPPALLPPGPSLIVSPSSSTSPTAEPKGLTPAASVTSVSIVHTLVLSSTHLLFSATSGQAELAPQTVMLNSGQNTFTWSIVAQDSLPPWLHLSAMQGSATAGITAAFMVSVQPAQLAPGSYTTNLLVRAVDDQGKALNGSPEELQIVLSVRAPCSLSITPGKLSFVSVLVSAPAAQTLTLVESSGCIFPVSWQASADVSWVTFSSFSGSDMGGAGSTINVQASASGKLIGSYTAHITVRATDSSGVSALVAPATITVTLTVIG